MREIFKDFQVGDRLTAEHMNKLNAVARVVAGWMPGSFGNGREGSLSNLPPFLQQRVEIVSEAYPVGMALDKEDFYEIRLRYYDDSEEAWKTDTSQGPYYLDSSDTSEHFREGDRMVAYWDEQRNAWIRASGEGITNRFLIILGDDDDTSSESSAQSSASSDSSSVQSWADDDIVYKGSHPGGFYALELDSSENPVGNPIRLYSDFVRAVFAKGDRVWGTRRGQKWQIKDQGMLQWKGVVVSGGASEYVVKITFSEGQSTHVTAKTFDATLAYEKNMDVWVAWEESVKDFYILIANCGNFVFNDPYPNDPNPPA